MTQQTPAEPDNASGFRHVDALDGLRGLAFLMVFVYHAYHPDPSTPFQFGTEVLIGRITGYGWLGVDLFFVLSGYLITGILLKQRRSKHYYRDFYARRALRIFPVYYLAVVLALWLVPALHLQGPAGGPYPWTVQIWFWLNLSNLVTAFNPLLVIPLTHFWSLAIEEQFYLVWPWLLRRLPRRGLLWTTLGLLTAGEIGRNLPYVVSLVQRYPNFSYRITPLHCDGLLCGALLALLLQSPDYVSAAQLRRALTVVLWATAVLVCGLAYGCSATGWNVFLVRWSYLAAGVFFTSVVGLILVRGPGFWLSRWFSARFLRWIGALSYALYVVHLTGLHLGRLLVSCLPGLSESVAAQLVPPVSLILCLAAASLSRVLIERPALRLKRYFEPSPRALAGVAGD